MKQFTFVNGLLVGVLVGFPIGRFHLQDVLMPKAPVANSTLPASSIHDPYYVDPRIEPTLEYILTKSGWGLIKEKGVTAEHALRYDRFSGHEIYDMILAGVSPETANAYPEAIDPWCDRYNNEGGLYFSDIVKLHNSNISPAQTHDLVDLGLTREQILEQYCVQKPTF